MEFQTIQLSQREGIAFLTFNRVAQRNSIDRLFLDEMHTVLDLLEQNETIKVVVLEGKEGFFCTGMDFQAALSQSVSDEEKDKITDTESYMALLHKISMYAKVVIAKVNGQVLAGGIGIVAASDLAFTQNNVTFALSEALWGLMPSMVIPYLVKRVGMQHAYRMTLTTMPITAKEALDINLVDGVAEDIDSEIVRYCQRLTKLEVSTIRNIKKYFRSVWIVDEDMEQRAVNMTSELMMQPKIRENIYNFIHYKKFPWEN